MPELAWASALVWLRGEYAYMRRKTPVKTDDARTANEPEKWDELIGMYLHRARTLGLDTPLGRQAIGKAAATATGYLASVQRVHGELPPAGHRSGEK